MIYSKPPLTYASAAAAVAIHTLSPLLLSERRTIQTLNMAGKVGTGAAAAASRLFAFSTSRSRGKKFTTTSCCFCLSRQQPFFLPSVDFFFFLPCFERGSSSSSKVLAADSSSSCFAAMHTEVLTASSSDLTFRAAALARNGNNGEIRPTNSATQLLSFFRPLIIPTRYRLNNFESLPLLLLLLLLPRRMEDGEDRC